MTEAEGVLGVGQVKALGLMEPDEVAGTTLQALREDRFLVLPHPEVAEYEQRRGGPTDSAGWPGCGGCAEACWARRSLAGQRAWARWTASRPRVPAL